MDIFYYEVEYWLTDNSIKELKIIILESQKELDGENIFEIIQQKHSSSFDSISSIKVLRHP